MTRNRDLGIITIHSEQDYRNFLVEQQEEMERYVQRQNDIERPKDDITWEVMCDLNARANRGYAKYDTTLQENNHQNMLQHAYEEALDLSQYLKKEITTLNTVQDLVKQYSNDAELGAKVREMYGQR